MTKIELVTILLPRTYTGITAIKSLFERLRNNMNISHSQFPGIATGSEII